MMAFALAAFLAVGAQAQATAGFTAPDFPMTQTWNNPHNRTKLADFKGEYVHLIFWGTF